MHAVHTGAEEPVAGAVSTLPGSQPPVMQSAWFGPLVHEPPAHTVH